MDGEDLLGEQGSMRERRRAKYTLHRDHVKCGIESDVYGACGQMKRKTPTEQDEGRQRIVTGKCGAKAALMQVTTAVHTCCSCPDSIEKV